MRGASTEEPAAPAGKGDLTRRRILDAAAAEAAGLDEQVVAPRDGNNRTPEVVVQHSGRS